MNDTADLLARADAEDGGGRPDAVFVLYGGALAAEPNNLVALKGAGRTLLAMRRLDESVKVWRGLIPKRLTIPKCCFSAAMCVFVEAKWTLLATISKKRLPPNLLYMALGGCGCLPISIGILAIPPRCGSCSRNGLASVPRASNNLFLKMT